MATSTDARARGDEAAGLTRDAALRMLGTGERRLLVKIDSTMRGSVAAQVAGGLAAWRSAHRDAFAVVCPAYPAQGRTVQDGVVLAHGRRLEEGPAGRDPVTPVATSRLSDLLPGSVHLSVERRASADDLATALLTAANEDAEVLTVDAVDDADLDRVAAALHLLGERAVPAGSAGLAAALARRWPHADTGAMTWPETPTTPVVVCVTSQHATALAQVEHLLAHLGVRCRVARVGDPHPLDQGALEAAEAVVVLAPPHTAGTAGDPVDIAASVADATDSVRRRLDAGCVVAVGGDGVRALVDRWQADGLSLRGRLEDGVALGDVVGGAAAGTPLVTKAGGFGDEATLTRVVDTLLEPRPHGPGATRPSPTTTTRTDGRNHP